MSTCVSASITQSELKLCFCYYLVVWSWTSHSWLPFSAKGSNDRLFFVGQGCCGLCRALAHDKVILRLRPGLFSKPKLLDTQPNKPCYSLSIHNGTPWKPACPYGTADRAWGGLLYTLITRQEGFLVFSWEEDEPCLNQWLRKGPHPHLLVLMYSHHLRTLPATQVSQGGACAEVCA